MKLQTIIRVEQYQFIDNLQHIINPKEIGEEYENKVDDVKQAFLENGWEGDGEIGLIWLPPFVENSRNSFGTYVWHVKQDNNGISFLGYEELERYDSEKVSSIKECEEETLTITSNVTKGCLDIIKKNRANLDELNRLKQDNVYKESLYYITLNAVQNNIVASFIDYIEELYFCFLTYVIDGKNTDRLKLSKANVKFPLDEISKDESRYIDSWLLIKQMESAIWRDFKFKPFKEKFREICNAVDFKCNEELRKIIVCHVEIRNSFQHHEGQLHSDIIKMIGQDYLELLDEEEKISKIELWDSIILSIPEVNRLCNCLEEFITTYEQHISVRMNERVTKYKRTTTISNSDNNNFAIENRCIEIVEYIYYLQYTEQVEDIYVKTEEAVFYVYESSTFKVNGEEYTSEEFYQLLLSQGTTVTCNGYEFVYDGSEFMSKEFIPIKIINNSVELSFI